MRAWVLDEVHGSLRRDDVPVPIPGPGEVLVKVKASGLCHSDVGYIEGVIPFAVPLPIILGHEAAGVVADVGQGVDNLAVGDGVVGAVSAADAPGVTRDGAYADYILLTAATSVKLPKGIDWAQAAAATDAGVTSYSGVVVYGEVKAGERVGIVGLGGLGMTGARIAVALGATVYGVEPRESAWETAKELGVTEVYADVTELEGLDLDVVVDFAGFGTTTSGAIKAVKPRGKVVLVGLGVAEFTVNSFDLVSKPVELRGATPVGDPAHLQAVIDLISAGELAVKAETIDFDDIPDGLGRLERGEVTGRLVAVLD